MCGFLCCREFLFSKFLFSEAPEDSSLDRSGFSSQKLVECSQFRLPCFGPLRCAYVFSKLWDTTSTWNNRALSVVPSSDIAT